LKRYDRIIFGAMVISTICAAIAWLTLIVVAIVYIIGEWA